MAILFFTFNSSIWSLDIYFSKIILFKSFQPKLPLHIRIHHSPHIQFSILLILIHRQFQSIKTSMRLRKWVLQRKRNTLYTEFTAIPPITLQFPKPLHRSTLRPSTKLQKLSQSRLIQLLQNIPKPYHNLMSTVISTLILRIFLPILQIYKWNPIQNHLQFQRFKNTQNLLWNNLYKLYKIPNKVDSKTQSKMVSQKYMYNSRC